MNISFSMTTKQVEESFATGDVQKDVTRRNGWRKLKVGQILQACRRCRAVMEQKLGRKLIPSETVHHRNGNKTDDRPSNLELWISVHPKGQRVSDLVKFARAILRRYA